MAGFPACFAVALCLWAVAQAANVGTADLATSAKAACAQSPGSGAGATAALAKETVLLQATRRSARSMLAQATRNLSCEDCFKTFEDAGGCAALQAGDWEMMQTVSQLPALADCQELECGDLLASKCGPQVCNASCVSAFAAADGCAALRSNNSSKLTELAMSPALLGCNLAPCETELFEECFPAATEEFCKQCVAQFDSSGGCEAPEELREAHVPADCGPCGEQAMTHCAEKKMKMGGGERCDACVRALGPADSCTSMFEGEGSAPLPSECLRLGQRCLRQAAEHCGRWSAEGCHTVEEGDACFPHVDWAMQTGIVLHPEWYPGLDRSSSFEEFQAYIHQHPAHSCPEPCSMLPETACHTTVPGEECHRHATWAMEAGVAASPEAYPAELRNENSTLEHFQAWLHHVHHGDCLEPCRLAEAA